MRLHVFLTLFGIELIFAVVYALLVAAASWLWRRDRTFVGILPLVGFGLALLFEIASLLERGQFVAKLGGTSHDTLFLVEQHAYLRYLTLLGLSLAAVGLIWRALSSGKHRRIS